MTINLIIDEYRTTRCDDAFSQIYETIYEGSKKIVQVFARRYYLDEHDVESMINEKILSILETYDSSRGKFRNLVFNAIKFGCIDLARKRNRYDEFFTEVMCEDDEGTSNEIYEVIAVAPTTGEDEIVEGIQKKHDQRQLIAFLLSKADEPTLTSASAFIALDSYRQAAKQVGTTHVTVKSRIRRLSRNYNEKMFGSYYDYFTEPTVFVG